MYKIPFRTFENTDKFRPAAIHFQQYGYYTSAPKGTTAYREYWDEERKRCLYGYNTEDGDRVTGYHYFYLNYCPIVLVKEIESINNKGEDVIKKDTIRDFPRFYDFDKYFFDIIEECENSGKHLAVLKSRRKGYSYKVGSMLNRNFYFIPDSKGYAIASLKDYLIKDGLLTKAWDMMDFIDEHTAWGKKRQKIDSKIHKRASLVVDKGDGIKTEIGYKSEIIGITLGNNPEAARGMRGKLMVFEEGGKFPNLKQAWQVARPSMEQGSITHGILIVFGCVCKGSKVWTKTGDLVNIEDLHKEDGILGYNTYSSEKQNIKAFREPYKTNCIQIITNTGREIKCSLDHPIIYSHKTKTRRVPGKRKENLHMKSWAWKEAKDFKLGDQVGVLDEVGIFGTEKMWNPRLIGWLIGDGSYGYDKTPRLSNCEEEINNYLDSNFNTVTEKQYITKNNKLYKETRIKDICYRLRGLGIYGQVKENKRLPTLIFKCNKTDVCELLGGLFDTDGYINKSETRITLTSAYKELLLEVLFLLQKIGIHGIIKQINTKNRGRKIKDNIHYRLSISDKKSILNFVENIKLYPKYKQEALDKYNLFLKDKKSKYSNYISGIRFERIVEINDLGEQEVYNLQADGSHTYIVNGIITHNTGGSEDSDFEGLKDIFYEPDAYGCLEIENVWEEENVLRPSGFYVPYTSNLDGGDENGNPFMDEQGNSLISSCKNYVLKERQKVISGASDRTMIDRYVAERCVTADTWVSYDGGIDRIVNIPGHFGNGKKDVYKLKTNDGTELFITDNHPVYNGTDYIRVKDLKEGDIIKHLPINFNKEYVSIPIESDFKFLKYDLKIDEEWAEFLGFYMGDGCFYGKSGAISIVFDDKDISSRERMYNFMLKYFGNVSIVKKKGCTSLQSTNKNYIKLFKSLDLVEKSSTNSKWHWKRKIHIPDYIVKSPKSVVAAFLRGLFDSDGHIIKSGRSIGFFSKYKHMCTAVQLLLRGFDINTKYKTRNSINGNGYNYIENKIVIRASDIEKFRNNIGFVSERKQQILNNYKPTWTTKDYSFTTVESITFDRIDEVYDLETQNHYYSANGLWVHNSLTPSEACLNVSTNIFPKEEMLNHLANLRNSTKLKELKQVGDLIFDGTGKVSWVPTNTPKDILKYRLKPNDDKNGQVVIWEHPIDNPPYGLYILGVDPYDHDKSTTNSLLSVYVYKRFSTISDTGRMVVAEYTGRPEFAEDAYEIVRKLALYYNGTIMYENQCKGLFPYFTHKHSEYLLADQPGIIKDIVKLSNVSRGKGIHMSKEIKIWMEGKIRQWLNEETSPGIKRLTTIMSEPLLEELISYNDKGNFDRVIAFGLTLIYEEELFRVIVKKHRKDINDRLLFREPVFQQEHFKF